MCGSRQQRLQGAPSALGLPPVMSPGSSVRNTESQSRSAYTAVKGPQWASRWAPKSHEKHKGWASWRPSGQGGVGGGRSGCRPLSMTPPAQTSHRKTSSTTKTNTQQGQGCAACDGWWSPLREPGRTARWNACARACQASSQAPPHPTPAAVAPALLGPSRGARACQASSQAPPHPTPAAMAPALLGPSRGCPPAEAHPYWLRLSWGVLGAGLHSTPSQPSPRGPSPQMRGCQPHGNRNPQACLQTQNCDVLKVFS